MTAPTTDNEALEGVVREIYAARTGDQGPSLAAAVMILSLRADRDRLTRELAEVRRERDALLAAMTNISNTAWCPLGSRRNQPKEIISVIRDEAVAALAGAAHDR